MSADQFLYEKMSWPEIDTAARAGKLVLLPVATIEDHGPHLPVDTDVVIVSAICRRTAELIPEEVVLSPTVKFGYSPHHIDFPGTITIRWNTFVEYLLDILRSLIHHGFHKILMVNGHGSNAPLAEMACRLGVVEHPDSICASVSWWELADVRKVVAEIRESEVTSHACELETSLYLAIDPKPVKMNKAARDITMPMSAHFFSDLVGGKPKTGFKNPVHLTEYWSTVTENGVRGDPTKATAEKGTVILDAASKELVEVLRELKERRIRKRVPHQSGKQ
ncbi:MAG: creatininase family protein [Deltaproteobacteria bacterium]|nr:creatininase family protein [Deltaproteobacteria bacterium]MBW1962007.1 creatininase family protein [Deltaproteobacteria bacterium]MBW2151312.1 creatininase family protein [Deltaproteobacteria bacterium]